MNKTNPSFLRWVALGGLVVVAGILSFVFLRPGATSGISAPQRVAFQIATGSTTGTYFPIGEFLDGMLSHPPGMGRCETENVCGPAGLIVNTRASEGSAANIASVISGASSSGLAQADVVALALKGQGPFRNIGPVKDLRVIANLYGEDVHLLASTDAKILSVADLRGKRVSLGAEGSGTALTARAVLNAYRLGGRVSAEYSPSDVALENLRTGRIDALFFVGAAPVALVAQSLEQGIGVLIPIDGDGRARLLKEAPYLQTRTIPQGIYVGAPPLDTIGTSALWITNVRQPDELVYGMVKALYNPLNAPLIEGRFSGFDFLKLETASRHTVVPLHNGSARFFREASVLPES